ncbi:MAG: hypothetical protein R2778_14060 [Saprospiraceae bacterium]
MLYQATDEDIRLAWNVELQTGSDWWNIRVDAISGKCWIKTITRFIANSMKMLLKQTGLIAIYMTLIIRLLPKSKYDSILSCVSFPVKVRDMYLIRFLVTHRSNRHLLMAGMMWTGSLAQSTPYPWK